MRDKTKYTPMMQQYLTIKEQYQDAFVFFRLGDFYELFFEDALLASKELEIALTGRGAGDEERVPMCGVPHHAADNYMNRLIEKGYKVAVCEQVEDPTAAKGVVRREVVRVLTPGTVMTQGALNEKENNFIAAIKETNDTYALAYSDLSTGENQVVSLPKEPQTLIAEIISLSISEVIVSLNFDDSIFASLNGLKQIVISREADDSVPIAFQILVNEISDETLQAAFGRLVQYLVKTQKNTFGHLQPVTLTKLDETLRIDYNSRRNLELTETIRSKSRQGSLLWLLDKSKTAMGSRLLKTWLEKPSINEDIISRRLDTVEAFMQSYMIKEEFKQCLNEVYDLERLCGRIAFGNANGRDLLQLNRSLLQLPVIKDLLLQLQMPSVTTAIASMQDCDDITNLLTAAISEQAPLTIKEGQLIKDGYDTQLDEYRYVIRHGKEWILALEAAEREKTGIRSLKIKYNKVFGYYIEISKTNLHLIQDEFGYVRKQTLANAERYITDELKEKESLILNAEDKSIQREYELFLEIRDEIKAQIPMIQHIAKTLAYFDVLQAFATMSEQNQYVRPRLNHEHVVDVSGGRHPVVEKVLQNTTYVENDCFMDEALSVALITGPNMSGKSTYMRQMALISVMAQVGCFVPATAANLPIFDQIFTRIGAADDLVSGHSTFMVEMMETNYALEHATKNSLILLDEIGRGTATFDGMALAQSIIEYIHDHIGAKTLFSTHYHELTQLETNCVGLKNLHVRAKEHEGELIFMHKVMEGPSDRSYGIHVAKIANLPETLIARADALLHELEAEKTQTQGQLSLFDAAIKPTVKIKEVIKEVPVIKEVEVIKEIEVIKEVPVVQYETTSTSTQTSQELEGIMQKLNALELYELTPMQAMNVLYELICDTKKINKK